MYKLVILAAVPFLTGLTAKVSRHNPSASLIFSGTVVTSGTLAMGLEQDKNGNLMLAYSVTISGNGGYASKGSFPVINDKERILYSADRGEAVATIRFNGKRSKQTEEQYLVLAKLIER